MASRTNLTSSEMAIVDSVAHLGNTNWRCKYCDEHFRDVIPAVTHSILECPSSITANDLNTMSTSSVVTICAHLDPEGCTKMLESYQRVYGITPASENSGRVNLGEDDIPMSAADETDNGQDQDRNQNEPSSDESASETAENAAQTFSETPPIWLSEADQKKWRHHYSQSTKIRSVLETNRKPQPPHAVDQEAAVEAWNRRWGWMPQFAAYGKFPALSSRMSRDRQFLRELVGKGP